MPTIIDMLVNVKRIREEVLNIDYYLSRIRDVVLRLDSNAELMLLVVT
jgi:hypothetical protein